MECCFASEYIKQVVKNPEYSEPQWYPIDDGLASLEFPSAKLIYIHTLIVPIMDGGAGGGNLTFSINGITLIKWRLGVGLQSDVKIVPLNYFVPSTKVNVRIADTNGLDFCLQLTVITEKKC